MQSYNLSLAKVTECLDHVVANWTKINPNAPTGSFQTLLEFHSLVDQAMAFKLEDEPASMAEWGDVWATAADLAEMKMLRLPFPVMYFEFDIHRPRTKGAMLVREFTQGGQVGYVSLTFAKHERGWTFLPICAVTYLSDACPKGMPGRAIWLHDGSPAGQDAETALAVMESKTREWTPEEATAHMVVEGKEVFAYLIIALLSAGTEGEAVDAPERLNKSREANGKTALKPCTVVRTRRRFQGGEPTGEGPAKRPHMRRSHIWGRFARPREQWQLRPATFVNGRAGGPILQ